MLSNKWKTDDTIKNINFVVKCNVWQLLWRHEYQCLLWFWIIFKKMRRVSSSLHFYEYLIIFIITFICLIIPVELFCRTSIFIWHFDCFNKSFQSICLHNFFFYYYYVITNYNVFHFIFCCTTYLTIETIKFLSFDNNKTFVFYLTK